MLLTKKNYGDIKGRLVYNGKKTRDWISREDKSSPTGLTESFMLSCTVDFYERREVMSMDIPNVAIQARVLKQEIGNRIIMKIRGRLVD